MFQKVNKIAQEASKVSQTTSSNWVLGDKGYYNLNKYSRLYIHKNTNSAYNGTKPWAAWGVIGKSEGRIIKTFDDSKESYKWLAEVINGR